MNYPASYRNEKRAAAAGKLLQDALNYRTEGA
jgi:hypothetical protein